jgi:mannitol/fructose-specific phosphotransferase system IIA component (Ntr-type)
MKLLDLIRSQLILPDLKESQKREAIREVIDFMAGMSAFPPTARDAVLKAVYGREDFMSTGMEHGIALPHGVTDAVDEEVACIAISRAGIPFESFDSRPAHILILLVTPTAKAITRVRTLAEIARVVNDPAVRRGLIAAGSVEEALKVLRGEKRC